MLKKLEVLNGELSLKFDPLNTKYTVNMNTNDNELKLELEATDDSEISIFNNKIDNNTEVVITVYNDTDIMSYYLEVYKIDNKNVANVNDYFSTLEVNSKKEIPNYVAPLIASICFLIILFFFSLLFKKRKNTKNIKL